MRPSSSLSPYYLGRPSGAPADAVWVAGFWRRLVQALVDLALVVAMSALVAFLGGALAHLSLPRTRHASLDTWLDLILSGDPALLVALAVITLLGGAYLVAIQAVAGRTLGMALLGLRVIDAHGNEPRLLAAVLRTVGYFAGLATLGLGFVWIGFSRERRGLHDWLAGTYVVAERRA